MKPQISKEKLDCLRLVMCPPLAPHFQPFFLFFLLRPLTVLMKQARQAIRAFKQSILLRCLWMKQTGVERVQIIEMKGITRCKLTIISESAVCKKLLGQIVSYFEPTRPVYRFLIVIHYNAMLLFKCFCFCLYNRFERIFISFLWFI